MALVIGCPRDCYDACRLIVHKAGEKIARIEAGRDPFTRGILCPRAAKDIERVYSPLRVLYPAINIGGGVFRRVEWDSAIDLLISRLRDSLERYGPRSILFLEYAGGRGILTRYASRRLWNFLGATQTDRSICNYSGARALKLVYGSTYGVFPEDIDGLRMAIVWGFNPAVSAVHLFNKILGVKERGEVVTVDVRLTETAKRSTRFVKVKPGSDGYLALGLAKYLVDKGYVDMDFVERHTHGFSGFVKHLEGYTLDVVEEVTGVPRDTIAELAESMAGHRPLAIFIGYGLQRRYGGGEIVRAISILPALLGIHRGFYYSNTDGLPINLSEVDGSSRWVPAKTISMEKVGEELSSGSYKFVYIHLHNPVATLPNAEKVVEGFRREDVFVVIHETHWSDTARCADLVLPAPTFYEKLDVVFSYLHNTVYLNQPAIDPLGESIGEYQLMCEVAKRIGLGGSYEEVCPDPFKVFEMALGTDTLAKLIEAGSVELEPRPRNEYQTPSGRIELSSTLAEKEGFPPLPKPPKGDVALGEELLLISSAHPLYMHTQFEDVFGINQSWLHISYEDAEKIGLRAGDIVEVRSEKGAVRMKVLIDETLGRGVAWAPRQVYTLDGKRISAILTDETDDYGGSVLNSTRIKVRKVVRGVGTGL